MKIGYVFSTFPLGGSETFAYPEVHELRRRGHDLVLVPTNPGRARVHGYVDELKDCTRAEWLLSPSVLAGALVAIARRPSRSIGVCLEVLAGSRSPRTFLRNLAVIPKGLWLAEIVRRQKVGHIHAYWASTPATVGLIASRVSGVPFTFTAHRHDIAADNLLGMKTEAARLVRVVSEDGRAELLRRVGGDRFGERVVVMHLGVVVPKAGETQADAAEAGAGEAGAADAGAADAGATEAAVPPAVPPAATTRPFSILVPAALVPKKGHRYVFEAIAQLPEIAPGVRVRLLLAGDGPLREELVRLAAQLGLRDVEFLGQVEHTDLLRRYASREVDAVVLPSITLANGEREGIPVSLMEAMAYGIPAIGTDAGGTPELLGDGAGIVVPERSASDLARAIADLVEDPELSRRLGQAGRRKVASEFSVEAAVARLEAVFGGSSPGRPVA